MESRISMTIVFLCLAFFASVHSTNSTYEAGANETMVEGVYYNVTSDIHCWELFSACHNHTRQYEDIFEDIRNLERITQEGFHDQMCSNIDETMSCLQEIPSTDPVCDNGDINGMIEEFSRVAEYMCSDQTRALFPKMTQSECVRDGVKALNMIVELEMCVRSRMQEVGDMHMTALENGEDVDDEAVCAILAQTKACVFSTATKICGVSFGQFFRGLADVFLKAEFPSCWQRLHNARRFARRASLLMRGTHV